MSPAAGAEVLGAAGDFAAESAQFGEFMFPKLFRTRGAGLRGALRIDRGSTRVGGGEKPRARATESAGANAGLEADAAGGKNASQANPRIAPPLKVTDCSQITDGGAALVLCSERFARRLGRQPRAAIAGLGQHEQISFRWKRKDAPEFSYREPRGGTGLL
jgi:acetyl-CoA C-acetyltransferase